METLHLPSNIKVHYAALEKANYAVAAKAMGVNYGLFTAFPFVAKRIFGKAVWPLIKMKYMKDAITEMPRFICGNMRHTIQDSGLFSLLFGKHQDKANEKFIYKWYDELIKFTLDHGAHPTCVEIDAQAIIGVDKTWELRERMRRDLPDHRIINVFHIEDGLYGLDRLIEYSDYLAIGSGAIPWNVNSVRCMVKYIKSKKPNIDVHLLGCTNYDIIHAMRHYCTSCDSVSWLSCNRFGDIDNYHIRDLNIKKVREIWGEDVWSEMREYMGEKLTTSTIVSAQMYINSYIKYCGNQN